MRCSYSSFGHRTKAFCGPTRQESTATALENALASLAWSTSMPARLTWTSGRTQEGLFTGPSVAPSRFVEASNVALDIEALLRLVL